MTKTEILNAMNEAKKNGNIREVAPGLIIAALKHLHDFAFNTEEWSRDTVKDICYDIGELLYDEGGVSMMEDVYYDVRSEMKGVAARYLEHFWHGVGNGAWLG